MVSTTSLIRVRGRCGEDRDVEGAWERAGDHGAADAGGEHQLVEERGAGLLGQCLWERGSAGRRAGAGAGAGELAHVLRPNEAESCREGAGAGERERRGEPWLAGGPGLAPGERRTPVGAKGGPGRARGVAGHGRAKHGSEDHRGVVTGALLPGDGGRCDQIGLPPVLFDAWHSLVR